MKILFVYLPQEEFTSTLSISKQIEFIALQLESYGHSVEIIQNFHPVKLIVHRFDLIHFFLDSYDSLKSTYSLIAKVLTSRFIGTSTILSVYDSFNNESVFHKNFLNNSVQPFLNFNFLRLFDALTFPFVSDFKNLRFYSNQKMILPFFPDLKTKEKETEKVLMTKAIIFPVYKSFDELKLIKTELFKFLIGQKKDFYLDARGLKENLKTSQIRKQWNDFLIKNPDFNQFILFTENLSYNQILVSSFSMVILNHLHLSGQQLSFWIEDYLKYDLFLLMNEDQGSGFSDFWKNKENCYIMSTKSKESEHLLYLNTLLNQNKSIKTYSDANSKISRLQHSLDSKMNDLTRLYTKLLQQKSTLIQHSSVK